MKNKTTIQKELNEQNLKWLPMIITSLLLISIIFLAYILTDTRSLHINTVSVINILIDLFIALISIVVISFGFFEIQKKSVYAFIPLYEKLGNLLKEHEDILKAAGSIPLRESIEKLKEVENDINKLYEKVPLLSANTLVCQQIQLFILTIICLFLLICVNSLPFFEEKFLFGKLCLVLFSFSEWIYISIHTIINLLKMSDIKTKIEFYKK